MVAEGAVVVVGATSPIARALALELGHEGYAISLAGRDIAELQRVAADLKLRTGAEVSVREFDAANLDSIPMFWEDCCSQILDLKGLVVAVGTMTDQQAQNEDPDLSLPVMQVNYTAMGVLLMNAAMHFEEQKQGWIIGISSVAGDRGRASNYVYGSAKAGLTQLLSGLRARLSRSGVQVLTVKPGLIDTSMTFGMEGPIPAAPPTDAAQAIVAALNKRKDVIYVPGIWRLIMFILRSVPEKIFKGVKF